jgi:hypothetical protein
MSTISTTQRKLRHAQETFQLLQASARAIPLERELVERRLSDFLSAAYSVEDVLKTEIGKPHKGWVDRWWGKRSVDVQALHTFMRNQRNAELHRLGATVNAEQQEISYTDYLRRDPAMQSGRSPGGYYYGPQWSGPYGMEIPRTPVEIGILTLGGEPVTEKCARYLGLLEQMVEACLAAHPTP